MRRTILGSILVALALAAPHAQQPSAPAPGPGLLVYIGTYTSPTGSKGIYAARLDPATGALSTPALVAEGRNPSFLASSADGRFLYAVNELDTVDGMPGGAVTAYAVDKNTGALRKLNSQSTKGGGPCHVSVAGAMVFAANYGGGSVAAYRVSADGSLSPATSFFQHQGSSADPNRQKGPHAHGVVPDPTGRFLYVPDLGLDQVVTYKIDPAAATIAPAEPPFSKVTPAGSGPRHIAISRDGQTAYVINEMSCMLTTYERDAATGSLSPHQTITTLPVGTSKTPAMSTAEVMLHPSGRFLYGSNRGHNSLVVFAVDKSSGQLTTVEHVSTGGKTPRAFNIDPAGNFLVAGNQDSDQVVVFRIDQATGKLTPTGHTAAVGKPVSFEFVR